MTSDAPETKPAPAPSIDKRVAEATRLLEAVLEDRGLLAQVDREQRERLLRAAGQVARPDPWAKRQLVRATRRRQRDEVKAADAQTRADTGIHRKRRDAVFATPLLPTPAASTHEEAAPTQAGNEPAPARPRRLLEPRKCYVCKREYSDVHFFYDAMCAECADLNWTKRQLYQHVDLSGRVALITGARVKIGYQAAIMLLRAGARVLVSTRFPRDAAARYAREADYASWSDRLQIYGLDLRHTPSVDAFTQHLRATLDRLDFILNNACQTVRRPPGFYAHLLQAERRPVAEFDEAGRKLLASYEQMRGATRDARAEAPRALAAVASAAGLQDPAMLSQLTLLEDDLERSTHLFPRGQLDADLQQVDLRAQNSWRLQLADVSAVELLEVQLVNAVAPFILNARLKPLMLAVPSRDKHIVNVSAVEGQFYRQHKTDKHPHTNMAKAALNMMTRTSAIDYARDGIHMNSVDTGWVTDEDPAELASRKTAEHGFHPPLDIVDGAARICAPIFDGFSSGQHYWGLFLKDYAPTDW